MIVIFWTVAKISQIYRWEHFGFWKHILSPTTSARDPLNFGCLDKKWSEIWISNPKFQVDRDCTLSDAWCLRTKQNHTEKFCDDFDSKEADDVIYRCGITFWLRWRRRGRHVVRSNMVNLKGLACRPLSDRICIWRRVRSTWRRRLSRGTTRKPTTTTTHCSVLPAGPADTTPRSSISLYLALRDGPHGKGKGKERSGHLL